MLIFMLGSRGSSVSAVTRLQAGQWRNYVASIPWSGNKLLSSPKPPDRFFDPSSILYNGKQTLFYSEIIATGALSWPLKSV